MRVRCGTSGYNYDAWKGSFYPEKLSQAKMLGYYAQKFPAVEINYTFYRKPTVKALEGWAAQTPEGFRFALKAWQRITHQARLRDAGELTSVFLDAARTLAGKLGPILYQLPPFLRRDDALLEGFLALLPRDLGAAFEFRHASWFDPAVYGALERHGCALCIADGDTLETPMVRTAPYGYLRLRREDYTPADLDRWAGRVGDAGFTEDVYVFFKHEDEGRGPALAADFAERLASRTVG